MEGGIVIGQLTFGMNGLFTVTANNWNLENVLFNTL